MRVFLSSLVTGVSALSLQASSFLDDPKNRPVTKVINLLKDMQKQLEDEGETDQEVYDKMVCWCKTGETDKTAAIEEAENTINSLTAEIAETSGNSARLRAEIKQLEKELAANEEALAKATALRKKQLAEFNAEETDLIQAIQQLKNAISVLSKHNSLIQEKKRDVHTAVRHGIRVLGSRLSLIMSPTQQSIIQDLMQVNSDHYSSQSGQIFGILGTMKDQMESDLSDARKTEAADSQSFAELKAAKEDEIQQGKDSIEKKTEELGDSDEANANAKQNLADTRATLAADTEYLMNLREKCKNTDHDFEARQKARAEEVEAVGKALEYLNSDEAHDLFTRTFNFVQTYSSTSSSSLRARAAAVLAKVAAKNPRIAAIATSVKLDAFTKVKKAIDDLVANLRQQKQDEVKHRDFCIKALHDNDMNKEKNENKAERLAAQISKLESLIETLTSEIEDLEKQNEDMRIELKKAGENRNEENTEFQKTVADQQATIQLLGKTHEVLAATYQKSFLQSKNKDSPPPPAGFNTYEKNAGGGGVLGMLTQIMNDSKAMMAEAKRDEADAQKTYESFVVETNNSIDTNQTSIDNKTGERANANQEKTEAEEELASTNLELENLGHENKDLHGQCDFYMNNFETRQEAIETEIEALNQAKAILSGSMQG